jgi:hypothetical protein
MNVDMFIKIAKAMYLRGIILSLVWINGLGLWLTLFPSIPPITFEHNPHNINYYILLKVNIRKDDEYAGREVQCGEEDWISGH